MKDYRTRALLREWLSLLLEASGDDGELALWYSENGKEHRYYVYVPSVFYDAISTVFHAAVQDLAKKDSMWYDSPDRSPAQIFDLRVITPGIVSKASKGMMLVQDNRGVAEVIQAAAESRLGDAMYGLVNSVEGPIMPSRSSISAAARKLWLRQLNLGLEMPLPKGVRRFDREGMEYLDYAYDGLQGPWTADSLKRSQVTVVKHMVELINKELESVDCPVQITAQDIEKPFHGAMKTYFVVKYANVSDEEKVENRQAIISSSEHPETPRKPGESDQDYQNRVMAIMMGMA